ncbi:CrcB protein [Anoxybacillus calidus]|jgi:fluoride exporter|uniref:Fluoride-specific ion channel FluC n=1 Tax=[Anoxybacillus] calidus TaxID=575178 RepID=A0A7V9Z199_9BACL|nr:fluoride efflux transporter CrcB [Anoxybacillus calidus]MBA2872224.1 CrcB protein [Anoxybacillus calidus]
MIFVVGIGGILGAITRFLLSKWISSKVTTTFPIGTWIINITGSFILGCLFVLHSNGDISAWLWLFFGVGFLGAYTTFSTFGYETVHLIEKKDFGTAILYVLSSVLISVGFAWIGILLSGGR